MIGMCLDNNIYVHSFDCQGGCHLISMKGLRRITFLSEYRNKTDLQGSGLDYGGGEHQRDLRTHYEQLDLNLNPLQAVF